MFSGHSSVRRFNLNWLKLGLANGSAGNPVEVFPETYGYVPYLINVTSLLGTRGRAGNQERGRAHCIPVTGAVPQPMELRGGGGGGSKMNCDGSL